MNELLHIEGDLYEPKEHGFKGQRRYVWTALHRNCGGHVQRGVPYSWKGSGLKQDGTLGCARCLAQPLTDHDIYYDFR